MEFKKKTIIWEDNNEPPKDYIWAKKDGKFYEYSYATRSWIESKSISGGSGGSGGDGDSPSDEITLGKSLITSLCLDHNDYNDHSKVTVLPDAVCICTNIWGANTESLDTPVTIAGRQFDSAVLLDTPNVVGDFPGICKNLEELSWQDIDTYVSSYNVDSSSCYLLFKVDKFSSFDDIPNIFKVVFNNSYGKGATEPYTTSNSTDVYPPMLSLHNNEYYIVFEYQGD